MNEERLGEKCKSKNWKDRQEAYDRLGSIWEKSEECLSLLPLLQSETNIPALESAIDAILKARSPPRVEDVRKIFSHIGSMKTSTKSRVGRLVEFVSSKYPGEVVREMVRLVESKTPKTVLGAVGVLVEMGPKVDLEMVGESLGRILGHSDQGVRGEGMKLCVGLYKRHGERLKKYLKEMKPIQLKELEKKCEVEDEKCENKEDIPPSRNLPQRKAITPRSTPVKREKSTTCTTKPSTIPTTTTPKSSPLLESFYSKYPFFKDKAWNSRLEEFRKNIPCLSKEDVRDLAFFFYSHKEPIFQLTLAYMDLLLALDIRPVQDTLMAYCSEKVTETKLQGKIVEIFKRLDHGEGVEFLKKEIKSLKQGKKMVSLLWLLGEVTRPGDDLGDVLSHPVVGINEKRALEQLRVKKCEVEEECGKEDEVVENEVVDVPLVVEMPIVVENEVVEKNTPIVVENKPIVVENVPLTISTPLTNTTPLEIPTSLNIPIPPVVVELPKATLQPINHPTQEMNILCLPFLKSFSRRPKGTGHLRDIFTPEFIRLMEGDDFPRVVDLFDSINKVVVSDFIIQYYVEKDLPSSFFNSLLLFFISERYILHESECLTLLRHLLEKDMREELRMMDRVYPVTKLFFILQRIGTDESTNEILRLISKYRMFRGNKEKLVEELKKTNRQALKTAIRGCPDFLSFVDEIEGQLMTPRKDACGDRRGNDSKDGMIVPPSVLVNDNSLKIDDKNIMIEDDNITIVDDVDIESSLINITLRQDKKPTTPPSTSPTSLEDILDNLIDSDQEKSEMALKSLSELVKNDLDSILFSANSIVSSISIQLLDVLHRPLYASLILNVLLSLSRSPPFCQHLRVETLESLNSDLITMLKNKDLVQLVGDIITNLCLNSKPHISLQAYLSLFLKDKKDIPLKLIWRHSKNLKNVNLQEIVDIFETFYSKTLYSLEDPTTLKILTLHLKEIVFKYPGELEGLRLKGHTKRVVGLLKEKKEINPSELRK